MRERGLAEPGRAGEQDVVERLLAPAGGLDEDAELVGDLRLADEVLERRRPKRAVEVVVGADGPGVVDLDLGVVDAGCLDPLSGFDGHAALAPEALRSADWISSSALSPSARSSSRSASGGV